MTLCRKSLNFDDYLSEVTLINHRPNMPVLRIVVLSDISIVHTEAVSPHLEDKSPGFVLLAGGGAGSSDHGAGRLVTAQPEASPRESRTSAGSLGGL